MQVDCDDDCMMSLSVLFPALNLFSRITYHLLCNIKKLYIVVVVFAHLIFSRIFYVCGFVKLVLTLLSFLLLLLLRLFNCKKKQFVSVSLVLLCLLQQNALDYLSGLKLCCSCCCLKPNEYSMFTDFEIYVYVF